MTRAGADPKRVRFATIGTNLLDALRLGQVDAGMVQEPALTLITDAGGGVIANAMDIEQANRYLGGAYEFMGVAVRVEERERRRDEMARLARALAKRLARYAHDSRQRCGCGFAQGIDHRRQPRTPGDDPGTLPSLALPRQCEN